MFSTFTTEHGALIVRTQDVRRLEDRPEDAANAGAVVCYVEWVRDDGQLEQRKVTGTARENLDRLAREELEMVDRAQRHQQRQQQGHPMIPVQRGRTIR